MNLEQAETQVALRQATLDALRKAEARRAAGSPLAQAEQALADAQAAQADAERAADERALRTLQAQADALESELADVQSNVVRVDAGLRAAVSALDDLEVRSREIAARSEPIAKRLGVARLQAHTDWSRRVRTHLGSELAARGLRNQSCSVGLLDPFWPRDDSAVREMEARVHADTVEAGREALAEVEAMIARDEASNNADTPHTRQLRDRRQAILRGLGRSDDGDTAA
ncbi:MAG TPA: hypothetical protein PKA88_06275 [Polyangiaceae bacterium]|nr:hypothetical protein [Polyangiaceae bacterium]HMR74431.1 hypothetical protein [Polyangiaceae bacterium]